MHWGPPGTTATWGVETALGAPATTTSATLVSATAQASVGFIDNQRATVYAIRGQLMFRQTNGSSIAMIQAGIIPVPVNSAGNLDAADFSPELFNNALKNWMWLGTGYCMASNASVNADATLIFNIHVKTKRIVSESAIALIIRHTQVAGAASAVNYVNNLRTLVGRLG